MFTVTTADGRPVKLVRTRGTHLVRVEFVSTKGLEMSCRIPEEGLADFLEGLATSYAEDTARKARARTNRLIPVTQWEKHHSWPPLGGLRYLVFHADSNGFAPVVKRAGRRVLIDEDAFFDWVDRQNSGPQH